MAVVASADMYIFSVGNVHAVLIMCILFLRMYQIGTFVDLSRICEDCDKENEAMMNTKKNREE